MFTKQEIHTNLRRFARNGDYYAVGDTVLLRFDHDKINGKPRETIGRVIEIMPRFTSRDFITYEHISGDADPVDRYEDRDPTLRPKYCDASFIAEVLDHHAGPVKSRLMQFASARPHEVLEKTRSQYVGWPNGMLWDVLDGKYLEMPMPLDLERFWQAFMKHKPGVVEELYLGIYRVNRKPFERWVMRNYRRFLATTASCIADAVAEYEFDLEAHHADYDLELATSLDQSHRWFGGEGSPHVDELLGADEEISG